MEPTESVAPDSRLRRLRAAGVRWGRRWAGRSGRHPGAESGGHQGAKPGRYPGAGPERYPGVESRRYPGTETEYTPHTGRGGRALAALPPGAASALPGTSGLPGAEPERHLTWPTLPSTVVAAAALGLGAGFYRAFTGSHALFPSGTVGWALALLTGVIVGHLVLLGRAR
ncbi:GGDEF-domain containing protein, partial [Streptomyces sp. NPDC002920]